MDMDKYQEEASRTGNMALTKEMKQATFAMGLAGEAGEVVDIMKKHLGHGHVLVRGQLEKELGDVLWYIAAIASENNIKLSDVAHVNIMKLRARYPQGFTEERSKARLDLEVDPNDATEF